MHLTMNELINSKAAKEVKPCEMGVMDLAVFFIHKN